MRTDARELLAVGILGGKSRMGDRIEMLLRRGRTFSPQASARAVSASVAILGCLMLAGALAPRWIAFAQDRPAFEVASIKPNTSASATVQLSFPVGGRFRAENVSLRMLIMRAYKVKDFEISGGPGWMNSDRFDIAANAPASGLDEARFKLMLQGLLSDRFKLAKHTETKQMPVYALLNASNGSKLPPAAGSCFTPGAPPPAAPGVANSGPPLLPCGGFLMDGSRLEGRKIGMTQFATALSNMMGRPVIDKTGYTGIFDVHLEFAPEGIAPLGGGGFGSSSLPPEGVESSKPSIYSAIQQQLGLKLESQRGPVEILVIDHAEKPDAN